MEICLILIKHLSVESKVYDYCFLFHFLSNKNILYNKQKYLQQASKSKNQLRLNNAFVYISILKLQLRKILMLS